MTAQDARSEPRSSAVSPETAAGLRDLAEAAREREAWRINALRDRLIAHGCDPATADVVVLPVLLRAFHLTERVETGVLLGGWLSPADNEQEASREARYRALTLSTPWEAIS